MKTTADITSMIISEMYFRFLAHKVMFAVDYTADNLNSVAINQLRNERQMVYDIRMNMLTIAANMIIGGEY